MTFSDVVNVFKISSVDCTSALFLVCAQQILSFLFALNVTCMYFIPDFKAVQSFCERSEQLIYH
jgi:hypothetical protein